MGKRGGDETSVDAEVPPFAVDHGDLIAPSTPEAVAKRQTPGEIPGVQRHLARSHQTSTVRDSSSARGAILEPVELHLAIQRRAADA